MDNTFCKGKLDGYYLDPRDCAAFYQCSRGSAFRKHCLRGQVFNDILKACDSPMNFPCRQRNVISIFIPSKQKATKPTANPKTQHDLLETSLGTLQKGMLPKLFSVLLHERALDVYILAVQRFRLIYHGISYELLVFGECIYQENKSDK